MSRALRKIAKPFVAAAPAGARVRTRLRVSGQDEAVLRAVGRHLGSLAGRDLAARCAEGRLDAKGRAESRRERKRALTAESSSRWAGAITRTSEEVMATSFGSRTPMTGCAPIGGASPRLSGGFPFHFRSGGAPADLFGLNRGAIPEQSGSDQECVGVVESVAVHASAMKIGGRALAPKAVRESRAQC